jgi:hypothetical protein
MESGDINRIDKSNYKEAVKKEKRKLNIQVFGMTVIAFAVSLAFFVALIAKNPHD